jgi:hypothetical protein
MPKKPSNPPLSANPVNRGADRLPLLRLLLLRALLMLMALLRCC